MEPALAREVRDGKRDAISIDSNPLRRLLGKLIASQFPCPREPRQRSRKALSGCSVTKGNA